MADATQRDDDTLGIEGAWETSDSRTRREVLAFGAAGGLLAVGAMWTDDLLPATAEPRPNPTPPGQPWQALTPHEAALFEAVQDRLLPSSPAAPGARSCGTIRYLDAVFAAPDVRDDAKSLLRAGGAHLDRGARWFGKNRFAALADDQQDAILRGLERDMRLGLPFLRQMLVFTLEGFLGDPVHGGNTNEQAWRWLGHVPGQPRPTEPTFRPRPEGAK